MDITSEQREKAYTKASAEIRNLYSSEKSGERIHAVFQKHQLSEADYKLYALTIGNVMLGFYPISELSEQLQKNVGVDTDTANKITADLIDFLAPVTEEAARKKEEEQNAVPLPVQNATEDGAANPKPEAVPLPETKPSDTSDTVTQQDVVYHSLEEALHASEPADAHEAAVVEETPAPAQTPENETQTDSEPVVQPMRTMQHDAEKIHGYGAFRKMHPEDGEVENTTPEKDAVPEEPIITATPQDETLARRPLADAPSYSPIDPPRQS